MKRVLSALIMICFLLSSPVVLAEEAAWRTQPQNLVGVKFSLALPEGYYLLNENTEPMLMQDPVALDSLRNIQGQDYIDRITDGGMNSVMNLSGQMRMVFEIYDVGVDQSMIWMAEDAFVNGARSEMEENGWTEQECGLRQYGENMFLCAYSKGISLGEETTYGHFMTLDSEGVCLEFWTYHMDQETVEQVLTSFAAPAVQDEQPVFEEVPAEEVQPAPENEAPVEVAQPVFEETPVVEELPQIVEIESVQPVESAPAVTGEIPVSEYLGLDSDCPHTSVYVWNREDPESYSYEMVDDQWHSVTYTITERNLGCDSCGEMLKVMDLNDVVTVEDVHSWDNTETDASNILKCGGCGYQKTVDWPCEHRALQFTESMDLYCYECGAYVVVNHRFDHCSHKDYTVFYNDVPSAVYECWDDAVHLKTLRYYKYEDADWGVDAVCNDCGVSMVCNTDGSVQYWGDSSMLYSDIISQSVFESHTYADGACTLCGEVQKNAPVEPVVSAEPVVPTELAIPAENADVLSAAAEQVLLEDGQAQVIFTVRTTANTEKVNMYAESGALVTAFDNSNAEYTDEDSERVWKVRYAFANDGKRTMHFAASDGTGESERKPIEVIVKGAQVKSAAFNPDSATKGAAARAVVKTSSGAEYLHMYSEDGTLVKTWAAKDASTASGSERTWTVSYAFSGTGERKMKFCASLDGENPAKGVEAKISVREPLLVLEAAADRGEISANQPLTFIVKTPEGMKSVSMYAENGSLIKTWPADGNSTVEGAVRTWKISYSFSNMGNRTMEFKASIDGKAMSAGKKVDVKVMSVPNVISAKAASDTTAVQAELVFTVESEAHAKYLALYAENGTAVATWKAEGNSTEANGVRIWKIGYAFSGAGNRVVTLKASVDGTTFGEGKTVAVTVK